MSGDIQGKHAELAIERPETLQQITHALSSPVRLDIMRALGQRSMNVREIAEKLNLPMSTAALGIKVLEDAGLITSEAQPGVRGAMKLCSRRLDTVSIRLAPPEEKPTSCLTIRMPIGAYSIADHIQPTCGLASETNYIGRADQTTSFYLPERIDAQLIWFRQGFLEYRMSVMMLDRIQPDWLEISFEACSEAPMYRDPWKSDIILDVNGQRLGTWTCPCDCGGRHGALTPEWWSELSTQFGFLKTWRVDDTGSYLDKERISDVTLSQLHLKESPYITLRIGVPEDAQNVGGINLFGEKYGDYPQALLIRVGYHINAT